MYLYNEDKKRLNIDITTKTKIGEESSCSDIYKMSDNTCLKVYKSIGTADKEILELLTKLDLMNFYKIYEFYYNRKGDFKAHTMEYYKPEEIDILTTPTTYTLSNLSNLLSSVKILNQNNILVVDLHSENVILTKNTIIVIDADLYTFNKFYSKLELELKNLDSLRYLLCSLFTTALNKYHPEYNSQKAIEIIKWLFKFYSQEAVDNTFKELEQYKYPIDYIKKRVK